MDATTNERWLPIPGHEGHYEVSDHGRVRSLDRTLRQKNGALRWWPGITLRPMSTTNGYLKVRLGGDNWRLVHRLVLEAFVGPCPDGMECLHGNDVRNDARLMNLRWGTHKENQRQAVAHGRNWEASHTHCPRFHPLEGVNLSPSHLRRGHRSCWACAKAGRRIKWHRVKGYVVPTLQEESDRVYARLLVGVFDERKQRRGKGRPPIAS